MASQQEIAKLLITIEGQIADLKKDLNIASKELNKFDKKGKSAFSSMGTEVKQLRTSWIALTAAITGAVLAIRNLSQVWGNFDHKMREVRTLTKLTDKEFDHLKNTVVGMTRKVPQSAQELANALYDVVSAGVAVKDTNYVLEESAKAAVAGVTDTKTAVNAGLGVINAYAMEIEELSNVYDLLFQTVKLGVVTFPELSASIGTVLPVARAANVDFKDIAASIAVMTKQKIEARKASTFLRSGIAALSAPTKEAKENMAAMGITWEGWIPTLKQIHEKGLDLKQMRALIPDIRAGQAIISLSQNFDTLLETLDKMDEAKGSMQEAFQIMEESPVNRMKMLGNAINELKIAIVKLVAPTVLAGVRTLTNLLREVADGYKGIIQYASGVDRSMEITKRLRVLNTEWKESDRLMKELNGDLTTYQAKLERIQQAGGGYLSEMAALGDVQRTQREINKLVDKRYQIESERRRLKQEIIDLIEQEKEAEKEFPPGAPTPPTTTTDVLDATKQKVYLDALRVFKAKVKDILADLEYAYKQNQISIEEYYTGIREQLNAVYTEEVNALQNVLDKTTDLNERKKIQNEITAKGIELQTALTRAHREEAQAQSELSERIKEANNIMLDAEARITADMSAELQRRMRELLRFQAEEKQRIIDLKLGEIEEKKKLDRMYTLWRMEQEKLVADYEREMQIKRLSIAAQATGGLRQIFDELYSASGEKVEAFFYLSKAAALADAAVNGALAVIKALAVGGPAGIALASIVSALVGVQMGIIAGTMLAGPPKPEGMAEGGSVQGESGRDRIHKRLTKDEFVQPVSAVKYYGAGVMEALRRKAIPRSLLAGYGGFSPRTGGFGMVEGGMVSAPGETGREGTLQITNIVDPDMFNQYLQTRQGNDAILNVISTNAYSIKMRLGV